MKPFVVLDIETLGTPVISNHIAMPSFAFAVFEDIDKQPIIIRGLLNQEEQIDNGALTTGGTIKFWLDMALSGSATVKQILATSQEVMLHDASGRLHNYGEKQTSDRGVLQYTLSLLRDLGLDRDTMFYGNGPEFDMSIYSAHSKINNVPVPYQYWGLGNVRSLREEYANNDQNFKLLEKNSQYYAFQTIEECNLISKGVVPAKHDPVFDVLAEAYQIWAIKEFLKK